MQGHIMRIEEIKIKNQKLTEDLTTLENKHRHMSEKNEHLERDNKRL